MTDFVLKARALYALGLPNVARAALYHIGVKTGLSSVRRVQARVPEGPFFLPQVWGGKLQATAIAAWHKGGGKLFSHHSIPLTEAPPDWFANPLTGKCLSVPERAWWQIPDFDSSVGDIKVIWELSRMDWVLAFAQRARQGDLGALLQLNEWLTDWCKRNPPYTGPNWKCGQEASIRVMHIAVAALLLGQTMQPASGLIELIRVHLRRIAPTMQYAIAQDNNHGTSEAAALFIGGSWLAVLSLPEGNSWANMGRRWLENRVARLIGSQGSFSQYSLNYHRMMLDTLCIVEVWRRHMDCPAFSVHWQEKALAATQWLRHMVNPSNGDGPNLGANDGARLLQLTDSDYRDYRPTVQLAMGLFANQRAYTESGPCDQVLKWLGVALPDTVAKSPGNYVADDGGVAMLRCGRAMAMLRYPRFRFRPSQADALHIDLWVGAENLLRDAGTYSYNTDNDLQRYFGGTASHNTVQFDGRDQMPRISRFLYGDWLKTSRLEPLQESDCVTHFGAGYRDRLGSEHFRRVKMGKMNMRIEDELAGFNEKAVLRWRLAPGQWRLERALNSLCVTREGANAVKLTTASSAEIVRCELVEGWESRHYLEKTSLLVLEIEVRQSGTLVTDICWSA